MEPNIVPRMGLSTLLAGLLMVATTAANGQDGVADSTAAVQDPVEALQERIIAADSLQDALASATTRLELAGLQKPDVALRTLQEAANLLDSAKVASELSLRLHRDLAGRYAAKRDMVRSGHEWAQAMLVSDQLLAEAATTLEQERFLNAVSQARVDSLSTALGVERATNRNAMEAMIAEHARRSNLALMAIAGGFAALLLSVLFFFLHARRARKDLNELRQEVTWLRMVTKKGAEPTVVASSIAPVAPRQSELPQVLSPITAPPPIATRTEEEAMLLALVRRRGEERLQTLRDARSRGDHDKVVRVVHSLKPQLVSLDATYFTDLCGRLVSTDPRTDPQQWTADLDRFEAGMTRVMDPRS